MDAAVRAQLLCQAGGLEPKGFVDYSGETAHCALPYRQLRRHEVFHCEEIIHREHASTPVVSAAAPAASRQAG